MSFFWGLRAPVVYSNQLRVFYSLFVVRSSVFVPLFLAWRTGGHSILHCGHGRSRRTASPCQCHQSCAYEHFVRQQSVHAKELSSLTQALGVLQTAIEAAWDMCSSASYDPWKSVCAEVQQYQGDCRIDPLSQWCWWNCVESRSCSSWALVCSMSRVLRLQLLLIPLLSPRGVVISDFVEVGEVAFLQCTESTVIRRPCPGQVVRKVQLRRRKGHATPA